MNTRRYVCLLLLALSARVDAVEVAKADWIGQMTTAVPVLFCQSEQYFRQCFDVSAEQCEETMSSATRVCIRKFQTEIPSTLLQPQDGTHWGNVVGKCVGESYELSLANKHKNEDICFDISNWQN